MFKTYRPSERPQKELRTVSLMHAMNDGYLAALPLLLPFASAELGLGFREAGIMTGALGAAGAALALPAAGVAGALGGFRALVGSAAVYSASFAAFGLARGPISAFAAFAGASLGFGLFHPIGFALVAGAGDDAGLGGRMGAFTALGDLGRVGLAAALTFAVAAFGWRASAIGFGAVALAALSVACLATALSRPPACAAAVGTRAKATTERRVGSRRLLSYPPFALAALGCLIDGLASSSIFVFIPFLFIARGASPALVGSLTGAFFVGNMLGKVAIGKVADRANATGVFVASEAVMAALLVALGAAKNTYALAGLAVALGAVTKGTVPVLNALVAKAVPDRGLYTEAFAFVSLLGGVSAAVAPIVLGALAQAAGVEYVFLACAAVALAATAPVVASSYASHRKWN